MRITTTVMNSPTLTPSLLDELIALRSLARRDLNFPSRYPPASGQGEQRVLGQTAARGLEFIDSRPYQRGDDVRSIDWKVTARQGRPHTKVFAAERERPLWMVVDPAASMRFGSVVQFKSTLAARIAAWLAWTGSAGGHSIGGATGTGSGAGSVCPPKAGDRGVLALLGALCRAASEPAPEGAGGLAEIVSVLRPRLRFGDRVVVISDFYGLDTPVDAATLDAALAVLGERTEVLLLRVADPLEAHPPAAGIYPVQERGEVVWLDLADVSLRMAWKAVFERRTAALARLAQKHRWPCLTLSTDGDLAQDLNSLGQGR